MASAMSAEDVRMTLGEHFEQLRKCLIRAILAVGIGIIICFVFRVYLLKVMLWPLSIATGGSPPNLYYFSPAEAFSTLIRLCLIVGAILAGPYALWELWRFVAVGLYPHERRAVRKYLLPSIILFALGITFFFVIVAPIVLRFFILFAQSNFPHPPNWAVDWLGKHGVAVEAARNTTAGYLKPRLRISDYIWFISTLSLAFGLAFQTPLVVLFLARSGIVPVGQMKQFRRHILIIIMIISAMITPPDWLSMVAMSIPMYMLYEVGLFIASRKPTSDETILQE